MRVVIQRVKHASVHINGEEYSRIGSGLLILLGIEESDGVEDVEWLVRKIVDMRIFPDDAQRMNKSLKDVRGSCLVVSQFTLHASTKKGNRPSFIRAARPEQATPLYEFMLSLLRRSGIEDVQSGKFAAMMDVSLVNDGPVTIIMDSKNKE